MKRKPRGVALPVLADRVGAAHSPGSSSKGQSSIEFALVVLAFITLFLAMMQVGMYLYGLSVVENAARHGARMGSVSQRCAPCDAIQAAQSALRGVPVINEASVSILAPGGRAGSILRLRVSAQIPLFIPGADALGLGAFRTVTSESTFRQEGWR